MKGVGIDTCIVLRLLVGEPVDQAAVARSFVEDCYGKGVPVWVSDLAVAEAYHALIYHYGTPKVEAIRCLRSFLASPMVAAAGHALSALDTYEGTGAGLVDRMIRMDLLDHAHEIRTFDRDFAQLDNVHLLK